MSPLMRDDGPPTAGHAHVGRSGPGRPGRPARPRAVRAANTSDQTAPRRSGPTGGPTISISSMSTRGATACTLSHSAARSAEPGGATDAQAAGAVGTQSERQGGPLGPVAHHVLAAPEHAHGGIGVGRERTSPIGHRTVAFAAEGTTVGQRRGRCGAGPAPAGVGLDVGRLHPGRLQGQRPLALGQRDRVGQGHRAVAALHFFRALAGRPQARRQRRRGGTQLYQRIGGSGVVGEAPAAEHDVRARTLERRSLQLGPPRRQQRVAERTWRRLGEPERDAAGLDNRLPPGAAAQVGQQGQLDGRAGGRPVAVLERGQAEQDARGAEPALAGPGGHEGVDPAILEVRVQPLDRRHGPSGHPSQRRHAGDAGRTVHPDGATAALALGAAPVLDRAAAQIFT